MTFNPAKVPRKLYISVPGEEGPTLLSRSAERREGVRSRGGIVTSGPRYPGRA